MWFSFVSSYFLRFLQILGTLGTLSFFAFGQVPQAKTLLTC
jgi:hypothetical protein